MIRLATLLRPGAAAALLAIAAAPAIAQEVGQVSLDSVPPDLIESGPRGGAAAPAHAPDLGETAPRTVIGPQPTSYAGAAAGAPGTAARAAAAVATRRTGTTRRPPATLAEQRAGVDRVVFERQPVHVALPVGVERLITLPAPAALHVPADMAQVARIEAIDRTIYVTALVPFAPIRIVAELVDSGQQIPMDFVADKSTADARSELEVFTVDPNAVAAVDATNPATVAGDEEQDADAAPKAPKLPALTMVDLTRHAARQLYAPRRLAWSTPGISQVSVSTKPVPGLIRGVNVETAPLGEWRGGNLYVTAVRVTNKSRYPLEIPIEDFRGDWLAATAQHGRIGPAGSETDTTAVYLVCEREFTACLN